MIGWGEDFQNEFQCIKAIKLVLVSASSIYDESAGIPGFIDRDFAQDLMVDMGKLSSTFSQIIHQAFCLQAHLVVKIPCIIQ